MEIGASADISKMVHYPNSGIPTRAGAKSMFGNSDAVQTPGVTSEFGISVPGRAAFGSVRAVSEANTYNVNPGHCLEIVVDSMEAPPLQMEGRLDMLSGRSNFARPVLMPSCPTTSEVHPMAKPVPRPGQPARPGRSMQGAMRTTSSSHTAAAGPAYPGSSDPRAKGYEPSVGEEDSPVTAVNPSVAEVVNLRPMLDVLESSGSVVTASDDLVGTFDQLEMKTGTQARG